ncbi:UbiA family prenyltransferase [Plantactinospora sp. KBS50]|uniref:UbiA family prenyltransferase n=1 Tax=Plantactinospora sp. KBS50 TaxID=2024580 RepID=UPI001E607BDE|nr:UbiA family prenyltransferase [Plantactinospora sp. KBS50]
MARVGGNSQTLRVPRRVSALVHAGRRRVSGLIRACHPEPAAAVTAVAVLLAAAAGHGPARMVGVGAVVLASQLAVGWSNDWLDADRDAVVGRRDKPVPAGLIGRRTVGVAALLAALGTPLLAVPLGPVVVVGMSAALVSALLYNWPLKSTALSVLPYGFSFAALPACVVLALPGVPAPPVWLPVAGGLLGAGAHFANALPDLDDDARTGIRGLPHRLGPARCTLAAGGLLLAATAVLAFGPAGPPSWAGWAAVAAASVILPLGWYLGRPRAGRTGRPVAAFRAVMVVALLDVVLLVLGGRLV